MKAFISSLGLGGIIVLGIIVALSILLIVILLSYIFENRKKLFLKIVGYSTLVAVVLWAVSFYALRFIRSAF